MKGLRVTKNIKKSRFEEVKEGTGKKKFPEKIIHKIFETNSSFHIIKRTTRKV